MNLVIVTMSNRFRNIARVMSIDGDKLKECVNKHNGYYCLMHVYIYWQLEII